MQIDNKAAVVIIILVAVAFFWVIGKRMNNEPNTTGQLVGSGSESGLIIPG
ncbi:hypothetical protein IIA16_03485 [bacterium]|nr:hypothetical protein [bacterium]